MLKRLLSFFLALTLCAGLIPAAAFAQEAQAPVYAIAQDDLGYTNEEAFAAYAQSVFYGTDYSSFGTAAGETLTGEAKLIYDALVPVLTEIADGKRDSAAIAVGQPVGTTVPDVTVNLNAESFSAEDFHLLLEALLADMPYALYWFDKTTGVTYSGLKSSSTKCLTFYFDVSDTYQASDSPVFNQCYYYGVDTAKTGAATAAAANAQAVVANTAESSDYETLTAYKNWILDAVSYDNDAAANGSFGENDNPWQLINVFDGDPATNVVCEGYSKAFQYLCDLTSFNTDVLCCSVSGVLYDAPTGQPLGGHMWNVVELDSQRYLADLTNSDEGTVGRDGSLFLAGGEPVSTGYYVLGDAGFSYDADTVSLFGQDFLTLATASYVPNSQAVQQGDCGENLTWTLNGDGVLTVSGTGPMADYGDLSIGGTPAPWASYNVKKVIIQNGVTTVGSYAFHTMVDIAAVSISDSVTAIGDMAFFGCHGLEKLTIPGSVKTVGQSAFSNCQTMTALTVEDGVTAIGDFAFSYCYRLPSIILPDSVTGIGMQAFYSCKALRSVTLPANLQRIEEHTFEECSALEQISVPAAVESIGKYAFANCRNLADVTFADGLTAIDKAAFTYCASLSQANLPNTLTAIGENAFSYCTDLAYVTVGPNVEVIGNLAFYECTALKVLTLPAVNDIGIKAFQNCSSLASITFQSSVPTTLGYDIFQGVTVTAYYPAGDESWTESVIADTATWGENITWQGISYVSSEGMIRIYEEYDTYKIGLGLTVADGMHSGSSTYNYFYFAPEQPGFYRIASKNPAAVISYWGANSSYIWNHTGETYTDNGFTVEVRPENVGSGMYIFAVSGSESTVLEITRTGDVYVSPEDAADWIVFEGTGYVPENITDAPKLEDTQYVDLTGNATAVKGSDGFYHLDSPYGPRLYVNLAAGGRFQVDFYAMMGFEQFGGTGFKSTFYEGEEFIKKEDYTTLMQQYTGCAYAQGNGTGLYPLTDDLIYMLKEGGRYKGWWDASREYDYVFSEVEGLNTEIAWMFLCCYADEPPATSGQWGESLTWDYNPDTFTLTISGTGAMAEFTEDVKPWSPFVPDIKAVILPSGLTTIADNAFSGCIKLTSISISERVTAIGSGAFAECGLTKITFLGDAPTFGEQCFLAVEATANYPAGNSSWTGKLQNYGGTITWAPQLKTVTGVKATSASATSIKVTWNKVPGATRYAVYRYNAATKAYDRIKNVTTNTFTDTGLTLNKSYTYVVRAYTPVNGKNVYSASSAKAAAKTVLPQVTGLKAASAGAASIKLTWSKVPGATAYAVYRYNASTKKYDRIKNVTTNTYTDTGRKVGTSYIYIVKAYTKVSGANVYSASSAKVTLKAGLAQVTGLKAASAGAASIKLTWSKVPGATAYAVYRYNASTKKYDRIKNVTTNTYTDTGRKVGTSYSYIVRAYTKVSGKNVYSPNSAKVTLKAGLAKVTGLKAVSAGAASIKLTWSKVPGATAYAVYRYNASTKKYDRIKNVTTNTYTDTGRKVGTSYSYIVRAYTKVSGKNVYSPNSAKVTLKAGLAQVTGLKAVSAGSGKVKLTWTKVPGAKAYAIYRYNAKTGKYEKIKNVTTNYYTNSSLKAGTTYKYIVRAYAPVSGKNVYGPNSAVISFKVK